MPIRNVNMLAIISETSKQRATIKKWLGGLLNAMSIVGAIDPVFLLQLTL